jgi:hypothetical protein
MIAVEFGAARVDEALRVVRALGAHRYVAGRLHLVHALAIAATPDDAGGVLADAAAWAARALSDGQVDPASRDESLWRRGSDAELGALLDAFWTPGARSRAAREALRGALARYDLATLDHAPFDESAESDIHPLLVDAGWELLPLSQLDAARHAGAIGAFGEAIAFESARFEEENAIARTTTPLVELAAMGPIELLRGADDDGALATPLVVWVQGNETYVDYVMRGVRRAAKV